MELAFCKNSGDCTNQFAIQSDLFLHGKKAIQFLPRYLISIVKFKGKHNLEPRS